MIHFGTCSWKYDSWRGIIYPSEGEFDYLNEYSKHFNSVEVDQWFWSLFGSRVNLPKSKDVNEYKNSVTKDFRSTIKVPNSLTLTHRYLRYKTNPLEANPYFMSNELFEQFLSILKPLKEQIGMLMFQFEYLNKQKMASLQEFQRRFIKFMEGLLKDIPAIGLEIRNPNYLGEKYFKFLD